jgi:sugar/nucleoside kinase (ribokinase family)
MAKKYDVVSAGLMIADILIRYVDPDALTRDSTAMEEITFMPGGDAQNVAITMTQLGNKVALVGLVGNDPFGKMITDYSRGKGVDVSHITVSDTLQTSINMPMITRDAQRRSIGIRKCSDSFSEDNIDLSLLEDTRLLTIESIFALKTFDGQTARVLKKAKELGVITAADTKMDRTGKGLKLLEGILPHLDYFLPSIAEVEGLTGITDPDKNADIFLGMGAKNVVIKLGERGVYAHCDGFAGYIPAYQIKAVDTTGSGDAFCAGLIHSLLDGAGSREALEFACACGAFGALHLGASAAPFSPENIGTFMRGTPRRDVQEI